MEILIHSVRIDAEPPQHSTARAEAELARLQAQVAWLQAEREVLSWAVGHDELTGLANRRLFNTLAPPLLRERGHSAAVLVLDLNGFKPINDRFGHEVGDMVLRLVAWRIASCAGDSLVARLGGDEFAAVLTSPDPQAREGWWRRAVTRLSAAVAEPMPVAGSVLTVTASIGIAPAHGDALIGELLHCADLAMYQAKVTGRSHVVWAAGAVDDTTRNPLPGQRLPRGRRDPRREAVTAGHSEPDAGIEVESAGQGHGQRLTSLVVELAVFPAARQTRGEMPTPTCDPVQRDPSDVAPASTYHRDDPIWVHRHGAWRPGVVEDASPRAVMTTYRCAEGRGTGVDTVSAEYVLPRSDVDAQLDRTTSGPGVAA
jgi:diguanylate cyclase (GGDEF)-like protein